MRRKKAKNPLLKYVTYSTFLFVVVFLSVLSFGLILIGIVLSIGMICYEVGLLNSLFQTFNFAPNVHINIGSLLLPTVFNIPIAMITGITLAYIGRKVYSILRKYLEYVKNV